MLWLPRIGALEPACYLFRRPLSPQPDRYCPPQERVASQLAKLGTPRPIPGGLICPRGPVAVRSSVAADFAADGRCRSSQVTRDRPFFSMIRQPPRNLL